MSTTKCIYLALRDARRHLGLDGDEDVDLAVVRHVGHLLGAQPIIYLSWYGERGFLATLTSENAQHTYLLPLDAPARRQPHRRHPRPQGRIMTINLPALDLRRNALKRLLTSKPGAWHMLGDMLGVSQDFALLVAGVSPIAAARFGSGVEVGADFLHNVTTALARHTLDHGIDLDLEPYRTRIDWKRLVYDDGEVRGVSLRSLVELGLYSHMGDAVKALKNSGFDFLAKPLKSTGGRPRVEYIIPSLRDAQEFCMMASTAVGGVLRGVILDHHEEFQKLLDGDAEAHARLAEVAPVPAPAPTGDPVLMLNAAIQMMREDQLKLIARVEELEREAELGPRPGELSALDIAKMYNLTSRSGKPHTQFVTMFMRHRYIPHRLGRSACGMYEQKFYSREHLEWFEGELYCACCPEAWSSVVCEESGREFHVFCGEPEGGWQLVPCRPPKV